MFTIHFTNHGYFSHRSFATAEEALTWGKSKGFDFTVHNGRTIVAGWTRFGGVTRYEEAKR